MEHPLPEVDLLPPQRDQLRDPQAVPVRQQDHGRVAGPVASPLRGGLAESVHLGRGEVLPAARGGVRSLAGRGGLGHRWARLSRKWWLAAVAGRAANPCRSGPLVRRLSRKWPFSGKSLRHETSRLIQGQAHLHVELEPAVGVHVGVDQRRQRPEVLLGQPPHPRRVAEHPLDHQRVDVDQRDLEQVQAEDRDLLVLQAVRRDLAPLAVEDEAVGAVPRSTTLSASCTSRRSASECRYRHRKIVLTALPSSASAWYVGCLRFPRVNRRRIASVSAVPSRRAVAYLTISSYCRRIRSQLMGRVRTGRRPG